MIRIGRPTQSHRWSICTSTSVGKIFTWLIFFFTFFFFNIGLILIMKVLLLHVSISGFPVHPHAGPESQKVCPALHTGQFVRYFKVRFTAQYQFVRYFKVRFTAQYQFVCYFKVRFTAQYFCLKVRCPLLCLLLELDFILFSFLSSSSSRASARNSSISILFAINRKNHASLC